MHPNSSQRSRDSRTRIPPQVERQMAQQMKKSMPASMQRYIGPYMQQHVVGPTSPNAARGSFTPQPKTIQPTIGNPTVGHSSRPQSLNFQPTHQDPATPPPTATETANTSTEPPEKPYDFILNPPQKPKQPLLPGGNNKIVRAGVILGGILVLFVLFSFVKGIVTSNPSAEYLTAVVQDQQVIIQMTTQAKLVRSLNETNTNFVATANPSVKTSQSDMIAYLAKAGTKLKDKKLAERISPETSKELLASAETNTYNETFKASMTEVMKTYSKDLAAAYPKVKGPNGRKLLNDTYTQAQLLLVQLGGPQSSENTSP